MKTLKEKIDFAIKLIQSAAAKAKEVGQPIEVCYIGGKDSDVILELVRMANNVKFGDNEKKRDNSNGDD